jgi:hypothetical protein
MRIPIVAAMRLLNKLGLATMLIVLAVACVGVTSASATTVCVGGTVTAPCTDGHPGGAVSLTSTNFAWSIHGSFTFSCSHSTIAGTAPATSATTVAIPVAPAWSGCTAFAPVTITPGEGCGTAATAPRLDVMWNQATAPQAAAQLTLPAGCDIDLAIPSVGCTMVVTGGQTIGNGTSGTGGLGWTNGVPSTSSRLDVGSPSVAMESNGVGGLCASAGAHTITLSGNYNIAAGAAGVTVIQ